VRDFGDPQECRDDRQGLIQANDRVIDGRSQFLDASRVLAAALEANSHARERRAQIVRNVVAGAGHALHECFDLVEHSIDNHGQPVERVVDPSGRQSFTQFPGDDALNSLVHLLDALLGTRLAWPPSSGRGTAPERGPAPARAPRSWLIFT